MGDGITTPFDAVLFVVITVGVPAAIFIGPIGLLVLLSKRRKARLMACESGAVPDGNTKKWPLWVGFACAASAAYLLSGLSIKMLFDV